MRENESQGSGPGSPAQPLFAAALPDPTNKPAFREFVVAFTDDRKRHGEPIERVIVELKHLITRSRPTARHLRLSSDPIAVIDDAIADAVRWCVARYFEER